MNKGFIVFKDKDVRMHYLAERVGNGKYNFRETEFGKNTGNDISAIAKNQEVAFRAFVNESTHLIDVFFETNEIKLEQFIAIMQFAKSYEKKMDISVCCEFTDCETSLKTIENSEKYGFAKVFGAVQDNKNTGKDYVLFLTAI